MSIKLLTITITVDDVHEMCADNDIPEQEWPFAVARVVDWSKHIAETAAALVNRQVESVVLTNQP